MKSIAAEFINVDLDLKSSAPLSPLLRGNSDDVGDRFRPTSPGKRIKRVSVDARQIRLYIGDGPVFYFPLSSSWRLANATRAQRANWQLIGGGRRVYWPEIDEDIAVDSLLEGVPIRDADH